MHLGTVEDSRGQQGSGSPGRPRLCGLAAWARELNALCGASWWPKGSEGLLWLHPWQQMMWVVLYTSCSGGSEGKPAAMPD